MKANEMPERIYIFDYNDAMVTPLEGDTVYVREDAFIEKVCDWLSDTLQTVVDVNIPSAHHVESIPALGIITQTEFIEKFKKEIEYLLD